MWCNGWKGNRNRLRALNKCVVKNKDLFWIVLSAFLFLCFDERRIARLQIEAVLVLLSERFHDGFDSETQPVGLFICSELFFAFYGVFVFRRVSFFLGLFNFSYFFGSFTPICNIIYYHLYLEAEPLSTLTHTTHTHRRRHEQQ